MSLRIAFLVLLLSLLLVHPAAAQMTIRVPADQPTIQAGIGAAAPGDMVLVAPGTYVERINFSGKAIIVTSEAGPSGTIIDGGAGGAVVTFNTGEGRGAVISGFTITNGGGFSGSGVVESDALIVQNLIVGNGAGEGGGIYWLVPSGARGPRLVNNTMVDNQATVAGQGSAVFADGFDVNAVLVNNILVAPAGQTALHCGNFNDPNPPAIQFNDVFTPRGPACGGICTNQTGTNGNLSADPAFVAQQGNDFHTKPGSPVIDAGDSTVADLPAMDFDNNGNARVLDGNGDGVGLVDMGVYELVFSRPASRAAVADSIMAPGSKNLNDGANALLAVDTHRTVLPFDLTGVPITALRRVTLPLTLAQPATSWGGQGRLVSGHRLAGPFAEGNGH